MTFFINRVTYDASFSFVDHIVKLFLSLLMVCLFVLHALPIDQIATIFPTISDMHPLGLYYIILGHHILLSEMLQNISPRW